MDAKAETAKRYLKQTESIKKERLNLLERIEATRARAETPETSYISLTKIKQSKKTDTSESLIILKQELTEQLQEIKARECESIVRIGNMIDMLKDCKHSRLLSLRYESHKRFKEIAKIMELSESYIRNLHSEALKAFYTQYLA